MKNLRNLFYNFLVFILVYWIFIFGASFTFASNLEDIVKNTMNYIQVDENTIASKLYHINNDAKVYFFWSYSFFTINSSQELDQVKKQLKKENLLAILKDEKVLVVSEYVDPQQSCTQIDASTADLFNHYPARIKTNISKLFLVGNPQKDTLECYVYGQDLYLPNDDISKIDLKYIKDNALTLSQKIKTLTSKNWLKDLYTYVMRNTSYDYDALDESVVEGDWTPYLASSFFDGKKVVCDGYSKTFSLLASSYFNNDTIERITGSRQNIDKKDEKSFLHSWVRIGDKYYDPTFDDSNDDEKYNYYEKPLQCFNLDHYTKVIPWRRMFLNSQERYDFIKNNADILLNSCPNIVNQSLIKDEKLEDFIAYLAKERIAEELKDFVCEAFSICAVHATEKSKVMEELGQYSVQYTNKTIVLSNIFKNLDNYISSSNSSSSSKSSSQEKNIVSSDLTKEESEIITPNIKKVIDQGIKKLLAKWLFYSKEQRENYVSSMKKKIVLYLSADDISSESKIILLYIAKRLKY